MGITNNLISAQVDAGKPWYRRACNYVADKAERAISYVKECPAKVVNAAAAGALTCTLLAGPAVCRADVTLPEMPFDVAAYATAGLAVGGAVFGAIAGVVIMYGLMSFGLRKVAGALQGWKQ